MIRVIIRWLVTIVMVSVGILHFVSPAGFVAIVPDWLPAPELLVAISGAAEIAGGLGLILPQTRRLAAEGLIALYIAVFPANLNMALHDLPMGDHHLPAWALWGRLPLQLVFIAIVYFIGIWHTRPAKAAA